MVMDVASYHSKADDLLPEPDTYLRLERCPLEATNKRFRDKLRSIANDYNDVDYLKLFFTPNATLSNFYGIPKLHKPNCPLRPIISSVDTVTHSLVRWLSGLLSPYLGVIFSSHLINSSDIIDRLRNFTRKNSLLNLRMVSLDVTALFTNVSLDNVLIF